VYGEWRAKPSAPLVRTGALGRWYDLTEAQRRKEWSTAQGARAKRQVPDRDRLDQKKVRKALYRPLDTRHVFDDPSWIDWYREDLHAVYAAGDVPTLVSLPRDFGAGPLAVHTDLLPDQHSFKGQAGGKGVFPLWLPGDGQPDDGRAVVGGRRCGLANTVIDWAHTVFARSVDAAQDAYDYVLAVLSAPAYAERYWPELEAASPRVPLTEDTALAADAAALGRRVREAWQRKALTTGLKWEGQGHGPLGSAALDGTVLRFANGRTITGIPKDAWSFCVSNYRVLPEWLAARKHWTATISQAGDTLKTIAAVGALVGLAAELDALFDRVAGPGASAAVPVSEVEERRRKAVAYQVDLTRVTTGPVGLLASEVTIDIDCEHKDGAVYLWGATVATATDSGPGKYIAFVDWDAGFDPAAETALAGQFADWVAGHIANAEEAGQTIAIYHYSPTEPANLRRALGEDARVGLLNDCMVDLLTVVRDHYGGIADKSLKTVARKFGATWPTPNATGADTLEWIEAARGEGASATEARELLLRYNEDDIRALAIIRDVLEGK
jgi:hypothetical protein